MSNEQFVTMWLKALKNGHNQTWLAKELKCTRQAVSQRAIRLRELGVALPRLPSSHLAITKQEIDRFNRLIKEQQ